MDAIAVLLVASILVGIEGKYTNKLIVDCLNKPDNVGKFLVNTYFADTSMGWRSQALRGTCTPGSLHVFDLNERVGYAWVKGESSERSYIKVTSQQVVGGKYMREKWSYKGKWAFSLSQSVSNTEEVVVLPGFPKMVRCDEKDGRDGNGYCELSGPYRTVFNTKVPYQGAVYDIKLKEPSRPTAFQELQYVGVSQGGNIHKQYWDYRNMKWNSDDCYTYQAKFSDGTSFEVTCPVKDFESQLDAKAKAESVLKSLGKIPKYDRSWLRTIAVNGGGPGSRAGANSWRKSMTLNLESSIIKNAYKLFLHEGAHVGLLYIQDSQKWKVAQTLDPTFVTTYAQGSPKTEDVAESYGAWMKVQRNPNSAQSRKIKRTIPNRLAVLDDLVCSKYADECT